MAATAGDLVYYMPAVAGSVVYFWPAEVADNVVYVLLCSSCCYYCIWPVGPWLGWAGSGAAPKWIPGCYGSIFSSSLFLIAAAWALP